MVVEFTTITVILFSTGHCQEIFAHNQAINLLRGICLSLRILENDNNLVDQNNVRLDWVYIEYGLDCLFAVVLFLLSYNQNCFHMYATWTMSVLLISITTTHV